MEFNNDPEWLRQKAAAEDGCDVSVGGLITTGRMSCNTESRLPGDLVEEMVRLTNENYQTLVDQTPIDPEAPHDVTCGGCRQTYTSTMPNWAELGYCDPCIAVMTRDMQAFEDSEPHCLVAEENRRAEHTIEVAMLVPPQGKPEVIRFPEVS